jgi:predicted nucleotidyltransferase
VPHENSQLKQSILKVLASKSDVVLAILFGSVAAGNEQRESDIDVAIDLGQALTVHQKIELISDLAEATGRSIDLVDLQTAGEPLLVRFFRTEREFLGVIFATPASYENTSSISPISCPTAKEFCWKGDRRGSGSSRREARISPPMPPSHF